MIPCPPSIRWLKCPLHSRGLLLYRLCSWSWFPFLRFRLHARLRLFPLGNNPCVFQVGTGIAHALKIIPMPLCEGTARHCRLGHVNWFLKRSSPRGKSILSANGRPVPDCPTSVFLPLVMDRREKTSSLFAVISKHSVQLIATQGNFNVSHVAIERMKQIEQLWTIAQSRGKIMI